MKSRLENVDYEVAHVTFERLVTVSVLDRNVLFRTALSYECGMKT